jgi:uncharacterized protein YggE
MQRNSIAAIGTVLLLAVAAVGIAVAGLGTAGAADPADQPADRTITVSADGEASAAPDRAVVRLAVTAEGETPGEVRDGLASGSESLRTALDDLGVTYETTGYDIDQPRRPPEGGAAGPAYEGAHRFEVSLDDPGAVGNVIDAAADANAAVEGVELTLSAEQRRQLRDSAIENAMTDARDQAETVAAAGGLAVTSVQTVDASERDYRPVRYEMPAAADAGGAGAATTIDGGDVSVTYSVQVTYQASV